MSRGVETRPGLEPRVARLLRRDIPDPLELAGCGIKRFQESRCVEIVAGADNQVVPERHRRDRREVLLSERRNFVPPDFLAGLGVEGEQPVVVLREVDQVPPHRRPTRAGGRAAAGLPVVVPEQRAVARVPRKDVERHGVVDDAVLHDHAAAGARREALVGVAITEPADDDRVADRTRAIGTAAWSDGRHPLEAQVLDVGSVDQFQRAVAPAGHVARIRGPLVGPGIHDLGGVETGIFLRGWAELSGLNRLSLPVGVTGSGQIGRKRILNLLRGRARRGRSGEHGATKQ